jgi:Tol biopolymer transport system component
MKKLFIAACVVALTLPSLSANDQRARVLMQAAEAKTKIEGDLNAAIKLYKDAEKEAGSNRSLVAQALLKMAEAYQKLGDAEAQKIYQRLIRDFADQKESVALARTRLTISPSKGGDHVELSGTDIAWGDGRVSPDGRYVSYVSYAGPNGLNLMVHDLMTHSNRALTDVDWNTGSAYDSTFSPDGTMVAYGWRTYGAPSKEEIRVVSLHQAGIPPPRTIYANAQIGFFGPTDWSPDGKTLAVRTTTKDQTNQIALVGLDGSFRALTTFEGWRDSNKVFFSPDGKYLAYDLPVSETDPSRDLYIIAADGSGQTQIYDPADDVVMGWSKDGRHLLFASDRNRNIGLWALPIVNGKPTNASATLLRPDIATTVSQGMTSSGVLYTVKEASTVSLQVAPIDLQHGTITGPPVMQIYRPQTPQTVDWSPDGKRLAYVARAANNRAYVAIREIESNRVRELHPALVYIPQLQWFPDGRSLLLHGRDIRRRFMAVRIDVDTGQETPVVSGMNQRIDIAGDGKAYYTVPSENSRSRAGKVIEHDLANDTKREVFAKPDGTGSTHLSPDRKWIVVVRTSPIDPKNARGTTSTVIFQPVEGGGSPREVTVPAELNAYYGMDWTPDAKAVLVAGGPDRALWLVPVTGGAPKKLDIDVRTWGTDNGIRIHPNGKQIAYFAGESSREIWALEDLLTTLK